MIKVLTILSLSAFIGYAIVRVVFSVQFDQDCEGYLKRAADANTVAMAAKELDTAIAYIESSGLTEGYTSVLYKTPDEDVGFWYENLKASRAELDKVNDQTTELERSNMLMKLRETLIDHGSKGDSVTVPHGISVYPSNVSYALWGILSLFGLFVFCVAWVVTET